MPGRILADMSENRVGGDDDDRAWPERARQTLWQAVVSGLHLTPANSA
jgi:hypothetical protein